MSKDSEGPKKADAHANRKKLLAETLRATTLITFDAAKIVTTVTVTTITTMTTSKATSSNSAETPTTPSTTVIATNLPELRHTGTTCGLKHKLSSTTASTCLGVTADKTDQVKVHLLEHIANDCLPTQKMLPYESTTAVSPTMSPNNCWLGTVVAAADTISRINNYANLMDSRCIVRAVDVQHKVDATYNDEAAASHVTSTNNNTNNFSDITKRFDSNIHHTAAKKSTPNNTELVVAEVPNDSNVEPTMMIPSATSTTPTMMMTTSSGSGNHQISNYKIHHNQQQHQLHQPQPLNTWHSLSSIHRDVGTIGVVAASRAGELASPRCQSRESNVSGGVGEGRCPSNESQYSGNGSTTPAPTPAPASPPVGLPLPATLAPAAAAALLPPQSAAMAAYFNAAAVAAQQNHLLLTNPLAAAASLVQQATQSQSPSDTRLATQSPSGAVDFSTKRNRRESDASEEDDIGDEDKSENEIEVQGNGDEVTSVDLNSPLDLSVGGGRKRQSSSDGDGDEIPLQPTGRKLPRANDYKPTAPGTWVPPLNPYLAAVAAASLSPKNALSLDWNGKQKIAPNEATKALEKMTEMTKLGSATEAEVTPMRHHSSTAASVNSSGGRHSAWQSHWLNKGADAVKDVFKCVWCKQSFPTLASLTTHMKETQHCGVNVPASTTNSNASNTATHNNTNQSAQSPHHSRHSQGLNPNTSTSSTAAGASNKPDLNLLIKETMPLPRKLVRGQDVWLGKGAEQTRQILKCMWCGQSFRSLAEMTNHMQETQHYTNIISQEQIISWKSTDEKSSSGGSSNGPPTSPVTGTPPATATANPGGSPVVSMPNSSATVSAVLTCKVCDQAFASLKELSNHMVKNSHYKEHMMRTAGETSPNIPRGRGRQTREKRKKSLPVRKLLELERAQQDFKSSSLDPALKPLRDFAASTKISCEKCGEKVETALFVDHIRQCVGGSIPIPPHNKMKTPFTPNDRLTSPQTQGSRSNSRKTADDNNSPISTRPDILSPILKEGEKSSSTPSVLNAIEQLIEKSFDTRSRHSNNSFGGANQSNTPLGSSILKRLGIDESVDYTKPLMDPQTMQFLRSYSAYSGRDRSPSESSSVSERGSSRLESLTPERNSEISRHGTPRCTPDRSGVPVESINERYKREQTPDLKIKSEPMDEQFSEAEKGTDSTRKISVKKEFNMTEDDAAAHRKELEQEMRRPSLTPSSRAHSPSASERSITPKSNSSLCDKKLPSCGSSLNALSSMFDSLNNMGAATTALTGTTNAGETNNNNANGKKSNSNPLAALQKLCEKTDPPAANTRSNSSSSSNNLLPHPPNLQNNIGGNGSGGNGNMVAFSWACNDAVMTSDSIIKCSFCDTPFCSKGAYRHHLSKVHFVKDDTAAMDSPSSSTIAMKSPAHAPSPRAAASPKSSSKSPAAQRQVASPSVMMPNTVGSTLTPTINPYDESPQSKFLKYTELAKQLSSKNV